MTNIEQYDGPDYGTYEIEAAEEEYEDLNRSGSQYMRLEVGNNVVRFLPPPVGRSTPFVRTYQHYFSLPGVGDVKFNCPRIMAKRQCPACQKAKHLQSTGNRADADAASDFFARRRVYAVVIDRNDEDSGPKILAFGKDIHEQLVDIRKNPDLMIDFTNPEEGGVDVIIKRKGTGKYDTSYTVNVARKDSPLGNMGWIGQAPNLESLTRVPTYEEILDMVQPSRQQELSEAERGPVNRQLPPRRSSSRGCTAQDDVSDQDFAADDLPF